MKEMEAPEDDSLFHQYGYGHNCTSQQRVTFSVNTCGVCSFRNRGCSVDRIPVATLSMYPGGPSCGMIAFDDRIDHVVVQTPVLRLTRKDYVIAGKKLYFHLIGDLAGIRIFYRLISFNEHILRIAHEKDESS